MRRAWSVPAFASASRRSGVRSAGPRRTSVRSSIRYFRSAAAGSGSSVAYTSVNRVVFPSTVNVPVALSAAAAGDAARASTRAAQARRISDVVMVPHRRFYWLRSPDAPAILRLVLIQGAGTAERTYDAIVVGSGISGGWAAKELT